MKATANEKTSNLRLLGDNGNVSKAKGKANEEVKKAISFIILPESTTIYRLLHPNPFIKRKLFEPMTRLL